MKIRRKKTRVIKVGDLKIGGSNPIIVQSMLKNNIENHSAIMSEIEVLQNAGCEMIRVAVPDRQASECFRKLIKEDAFKVPVVADIHFDHILAIEALDSGADCVRVNPGNIGSAEGLGKVILKAKESNASIRIGVNSGSIDKKKLKKNNGNMVAAMFDSVIENILLFENYDFHNFKISAKASSVIDTIDVYRKISSRTEYPLHLGITESGPVFAGAIKSSAGLGILLSEGIGDTLRVSLTDRSSVEVRAAYTILSSLGLRYHGVNIISCPTCGRTNVDLKKLVIEIEAITGSIDKNINIAVMGCIVNGPGEAKEADIGIAYGKEKAAIFKKGKIICRVDASAVLGEFQKELKSFII